MLSFSKKEERKEGKLVWTKNSKEIEKRNNELPLPRHIARTAVLLTIWNVLFIATQLTMSVLLAIPTAANSRI